jgi:cell division protein FtsQ
MSETTGPRRSLPVPPADLPLSVLQEQEGPFLRPRHRTRVAKRTRRGASSRTLLALQLATVAALAVFALWAGYSKVMASDRLRVARVDVRGSHFLSEGEIRELMGPAVGENILGLDLEALKSSLRASPWVADATLRRTLPDTLDVRIRERVPLALAEADGLYLMDAEGTLIELYGPRTAGFDLPIVRGLAETTGDARRDRAQHAGAILDDLADLAGEVSELLIDANGDTRLVLKGRGEILKVGAPPCRKQFLTFLSLRGELAQRAPRAEYFDLRFHDRIYAKQPLEAAPATGVVAMATGR